MMTLCEKVEHLTLSKLTQTHGRPPRHHRTENESDRSQWTTSMSIWRIHGSSKFLPSHEPGSVCHRFASQHSSLSVIEMFPRRYSWWTTFILIFPVPRKC